MARLLARTLFFALLAITLASCAGPRRQDPVPTTFDIRAVAVTSNADVPRSVIATVRRQLDASIAATVRPVPLPRAVMNVRIVSTRDMRVLDGIRSQAELSVVLADVNSGTTIEVRNYLILSFTDLARSKEAVLADAISSRLRFEYKLTIPTIRTNPYVNPEISTRMRSETKPVRVTTEPVVIPLRTAPAIGADADPILNSRTKVIPEAAPARIGEEPAKDKPKENVLESGAKAKVVIKPRPVEPAPATDANDEPCVETIDNKC